MADCSADILGAGMPDSLGHTPSPSPSRKQPLPPGQTVPHFGGTAYGSQFPQERSVKWGSRQQRTRERTLRPFSEPKVHFRAIPDARDAQRCPGMPTDAHGCPLPDTTECKQPSTLHWECSALALTTKAFPKGEKEILPPPPAPPGTSRL